MEVYPEDVNLRKLLQEVHSTLGGVARKGGNTIVIDTTQAPPSFRTDRQKLGQVLLNLVGNACKFTENGQILLRVAPGEQGNLRLEVADTGIGIAPEGQEKLFLPFTQVPGVQSAFSRGTGLGLPISRKLCQLLGGDLYVESEPGKGSTFIVHLPDQDHTAPEPSANKTTSACVG